ncbi:MAG: class I SAM-dependent methyltransferase [Alphaproteobacteria bacterium]
MPGPALIDFMYSDTYEGATTSYFAKAEKKIRRARRIMATLGRWVPGGRFLDIGCNGGFMVEAARERGFEAHGIDPDPVSIRYAAERFPGARFAAATIETFAPEAPRFDFIHCSEVIEHVPAVDRFIGTVVGLLKPGGHLYVTTPDIGHWRRPRRLADWDGFVPPAHCLYFRPASLKTLAERHGLTVVHMPFAWKPGIKMLCRRA